MKNESERKRWQIGRENRETKEKNERQAKCLIHLITYGVMRTRMTYFSCFRCACTNVGGFEYKCNRYTPMMYICNSMNRDTLTCCVHFGWWRRNYLLVFFLSSLLFLPFLLGFIARFIGLQHRLQLWSLHVLHSDVCCFHCWFSPLFLFFNLDWGWGWSLWLWVARREKQKPNKITIIMMNNCGNRQTNSSTRATSDEQWATR